MTTATSDRTPDPAGRVFVDGHVHLHECFDSRKFLEAARANLSAAAAASGGAPATTGVLFLCLPETGGRGTSGGRRPAETAAALEGTEGWTSLPTREDASLLLRDARGWTLLVVLGRQLVTVEGLEVLAVGTSIPPDRGLPLLRAVDRIRELGGLPIVPWGLGKWWFRRRRILMDLLDARGDAPLFLGDNAGRPRRSPDPAAFREARRRGIPILPGSDPLPLPRHVDRPGSYGFVLRVRESMEPAAPLRSLIPSLEELTAQPPIFGRRCSLPGAVRDQAALRLVRSDR